MTNLPSMSESSSGSVGFLTEQEQRELWEAALLMAESRGFLVRLASLFGKRVENIRGVVSSVGGQVVGSPWSNFEQKIQDNIEDVLWRSFSLATLGLDAAPEFIKPKKPRKNRLHQVATTVSGMASGFVGLPGVLVDIPFTTATILRSIAEIARDSGEDLTSEDTRRACLEVLAFGGPDGVESEAEVGYWAARIGGSHLTLNLLIRSAAGQVGLVLSGKILAQTVPLAGAVTGAMLNYSYIDYYQSIAKAHFCMRALERRTGNPEGVRRYFDAMLQAARDRRKLGRNRRLVPPVLLSKP